MSGFKLQRNAGWIRWISVNGGPNAIVYLHNGFPPGDMVKKWFVDRREFYMATNISLTIESKAPKE